MKKPAKKVREAIQKFGIYRELDSERYQNISQKYFNLDLQWQEQDNSLYPYHAQYNQHDFYIRMNDFPEEPLYTLITDDNQPVFSFNDWPAQWHISPQQQNKMGQGNQ